MDFMVALQEAVKENHLSFVDHDYNMDEIWKLNISFRFTVDCCHFVIYDSL